jgi:hypothetical protein
MKTARLKSLAVDGVMDQFLLSAYTRTLFLDRVKSDNSQKCNQGTKQKQLSAHNVPFSLY